MKINAYNATETLDYRAVAVVYHAEYINTFTWMRYVINLFTFVNKFIQMRLIYDVTVIDKRQV